MTTLYADPDRVVTEFLIRWIESIQEDDVTGWVIRDTDGGIERFDTKAEARDRLGLYAKEG